MHSGVGRAGWVGVQLSLVAASSLPPALSHSHTRGSARPTRRFVFSPTRAFFHLEISAQEGRIYGPYSKLRRMPRCGRLTKLLSLTPVTRLLPMLQCWKQIEKRESQLGWLRCFTGRDGRTDMDEKGDTDDMPNQGW